MLHVVEGSKYEAETISIILSFADDIPSGDSILGTPTITVSLLTGTDTNPSNMLYGVVSIHNGTDVEQRFRLGVPGNIYYILYQIVTTNGLVFEKDCYLAILPDTDSAVPLWLPLWEVTQLYPLQYVESLQGSIIFQSGTLQVILITYSFSEYMQGSVVFTSGTLHDVVVTYNYSYEALQGSSLFSSGTLVVVVIPYNYSSENLKGASAFLSGTLVVVVVPYSYSYEAIQGSATFTSGTLV